MQVVCQALTTRIDCPVILIKLLGPLLDKERVANRRRLGQDQDQDPKLFFVTSQTQGTALHFIAVTVKIMETS